MENLTLDVGPPFQQDFKQDHALNKNGLSLLINVNGAHCPSNASASEDQCSNTAVDPFTQPVGTRGVVS